MTGVLFLFLYSVIFVIPLLGVFMIVFLGGGSEKFKFFTSRKNVFWIKILNGVLFMGFSVYLLTNVL